MKTLAGCLAVLAKLIALVLGVNALLALGVQFVLGAFGVTVGFWPCFVAWMLISTLCRMIAKRK